MHSKCTANYARFIAGLMATTAFCGVARADGSEDDRLSATFYGFLMADAIYDTDRVDPNWQDAFRPSKIETVSGTFGGEGQASISAKQSRFGVKGTVPIEDDLPVTFKFEFDMFGVGVDEGQTTIRLRHAYGEWGQILAGQTHSLFMDIDVFPNVIDYWGPAGMVFFRLPQFRWTPYRTKHESFSVAIERPGNDVDPGHVREIDPSLENIQDDQEFFDVTAHYNIAEDWGHFQIAGIVRRLGFETLGTPGNDPNGSVLGWGVNVSGHLNVWERDKINDKLIGQVVYGDGIASYMNDGGTDLAAGGTLVDPHAEAVPLLGVVAYYDHWWDREWSSSIGYSLTQVDNRNLQFDDAFHRGQYASANLLWQPNANVLMGGEVMWGEREDKDGTSGTDFRFQFSAKYSWDVTVTP